MIHYHRLRSLEACAQTGARPVDLLPKSLEEFEAELLPQGVELRTIRDMFDDRETQRLSKGIDGEREKERKKERKKESAA